jgi:hypothetical protein
MRKSGADGFSVGLGLTNECNLTCAYALDQAVREFVRRKQRASLRKELEEGARRRAKRDLALSEEWAVLEEEAWQRARG